MKKISQLIAKMKNGKIQTAAQFFEELRRERARVQTPQNTFQRFIGVEDTDHFQALQRLVMHKTIFTEEMYLRQGNRANWLNADHDIKRFAAHFIEALRKRNIPFYVHSAWRGRVEQNRLKATGRSQKGWPHSKHNHGMAVDLVHSRFHWELTTMEWDVIGKLGKTVADKLQIEMRWGGDWDRDGTPVHSDPDENFWDPAHWELNRPLGPLKIASGEPLHYTPRKLLLLSGK